MDPVRIGALVAITALEFAWGSQNCHSDIGPDSCSPGTWQEWGGSSYHVILDSNLNEARLACQAIGGEVIAPRSIEENAFMAGLARQAMGSHGYMLVPCSYVEDGGWRCAGHNSDSDDDNTNFRNWDSDEPRLAFPAKCVEIPLSSHNYKWIVVPCGHKHGAICVRSELCSEFTRTLSRSYCLVSNKCLLDHVIREFMTETLSSCASACNRKPKCRSFNKMNTREGQICQLNNATRYDDPEKFQNHFVCVYMEECKLKQTLSITGTQHDAGVTDNGQNDDNDK